MNAIEFQQVVTELNVDYITQQLLVWLPTFIEALFTGFAMYVLRKLNGKNDLINTHHKDTINSISESNKELSVLRDEMHEFYKAANEIKNQYCILDELQAKLNESIESNKELKKRIVNIEDFIRKDDNDDEEAEN